jgi:uncharacterized protein with HEPN domain
LKNKDIRDYLNDIIDAAVKIQEFTQGITSYDEFIKNDMLLSAVIRKFEIIGEAIKRSLLIFVKNIIISLGRI